MKKILFTLLFLLTCITSFAQVQYYQTRAYAFANIYNGQYIWGDWQRSDMTITINLDTDIITVYSPTTQIYRIVDVYNNGNVYYDNSGGKNIKFYVIDQVSDRGEIRLRVERNGNSQIYIDFSNCAWVYNVIRTR